MKFPITNFILGSIMMLAITGLVYTFVGDENEACKDNKDKTIFAKCLQAMNNVKNVVIYGWVAFLSVIPIFFIINYKNHNEATNQ